MFFFNEAAKFSFRIAQGQVKVNKDNGEKNVNAFVILEYQVHPVLPVHLKRSLKEMS